jgi:hypothetical protein
MRKILLLLILFISTPLLAQEYGPHVKITFQSSSESREFSGTIIDSEESKINVLTCWHATMGFTNPKIMNVRAFAEPVGNTRLSANITLDVQKADADKDIIFLSGPNTLNLKFKRMKIGKAQLVNNAQTLSCGYSQTDRLITNNSSVVIIKDPFKTPKGATILHVHSQVIYGMSGGGLVYNEELYGVQSSGKDGIVSYCPADQLLEFVK